MAAGRWYGRDILDGAGGEAVARPAPDSRLQADVTALVRDLRDGWTGRWLALTAAYVAVGYATASVLALPMNWLLYYMLAQARAVLLVTYLPLALAFAGNAVLGPRARLDGLASRLTSFRFLGEFILATVAVHVTLMVFVNLKLWIPAINERLYDSPLWRLDALLHFGIEPSAFASEVAGEHGLLPALDRAYLLFFPAQVVVPLLFLIAARLRPLRGPFFFAYCLLWMVGSLVYVAWPSLGPVYYWQSRFPWLDQAPYARELQEMLIRDYAGFRSTPGAHQVKMYYGVAALPSLHVAVLALFAIATRPWRGLSIALWLLTAVTFVGSLALAWHYAVDGYLGVALAWGCWWVARQIERPRGA